MSPTGARRASSGSPHRIPTWIGTLRDLQIYHLATDNTDDVMERVAALFTDANLRPKQRACYEEGPSLVFQVTAMGRRESHDKLRIALARSDKYTLRRA